MNKYFDFVDRITGKYHMLIVALLALVFIAAIWFIWPLIRQQVLQTPKIDMIIGLLYFNLAANLIKK